MPKLLQINICANWGSTGTIAESIGLAAMNKGWESYVAYGRYSNPSKSQLIKVGSKFDTYAHFGRQRIFDNEGLCSCGATKKLIKQIEEIKPDVVQLHNIHDHYLNYKLLFEYLNKTIVQVVWTFHDCWAFTGHCFHFVTKDCDRWKTQCHDCPLRNEYPKTFLDRSKEHFELKKQLFQGCKNLTIVPCSDWMASFVKDSFLGEMRINVIHNGIDLNAFKSIGEKKAVGKFHILAVSNVWNKDKGLEDVFRLRNLLPEEFEITMVGLSAEQVKKNPVGIIGIERTQNIHELVALYSSADVLINPTYADTFPTVNLEALACGTPVITYRTGGSPEAVSVDTGFIVEQGDLDGVVNTIMTIKKSGKEYYSANCRKRAEECFDKEKQFGKYIELYDELLNQK